jgi:predicted MFS family arabinose efflux permease
VVGALAARNAGRLIDKGKGDLASKVGWVLVAVSLVIGSFAEQSLVYLAIQLIVMDAAMQGIGVTNQTKLISMFPESRSRVNAGYVTVNFIGAAIGSAVASALWPSTGWSGLMLICAGISIAALGLWVWNRKYLNRIAVASPVGR